MHWVIQKDLFKEDGHQTLLDTLVKFDIPYTEVKCVPMSDGAPIHERLKHENYDSQNPETDIPVILPTDGLIMVCGSITLAKVATANKWVPGSFFNENHDYEKWKIHYGKHLLNFDAIVCRYADVQPTWNEFFIRPCADTKSFSGKVYDWENFKYWQHQVLVLKECYTTLDADTIVMYGPVKEIYREARFFVVDGKIVTYSTYKIGDRVQYTPEVPPTMIEYAQRMVDIWQPARAFVIDIALTDDADDGYNKIVEINCINSAGFYHIDVQKFVMAIEDMEFK